MTVSTTFSITKKQLPKYSGDPLESVIVRVFTLSGETFVTQGTTDSSGELVLELEDATQYWVRFFKMGYEFASRLSIETAGDSTFDVEGKYLEELPPSANQYLCRISGYVRNAAMSPAPGIRATFKTTGQPCVYAGEALILNDVVTHSNKEGWMEVELPRGAAYDCVIQGMGDRVLRILVPDEDSARLSDVLFPAFIEMEYSSSSVSVAETEEVEVDIVGTLSSGAQTPFEQDNDDWTLARNYLTLTVTDESVCEIAWGEYVNGVEKLVVTGKVAGTTTITAKVADGIEATRMPEPTRSLETLTVTVT